MMDYGILADAVAYLHVAVIVMLLSGMCAFAFYENRFFRTYYLYVYIPVTFITVGSQMLFCNCPLVLLENSLRSHVDPSHVRMESFVTTYCERYFDVYIAPELVTLAILFLGLLTVVMIVHMIRHRMR